MKKLKNFSDLGKPLTNEELKKIVGGVGTCAAYIPSSYTGGGTSGTYTGTNATSSNGDLTMYGVSYTDAINMTNGISGAKWCCDSCSSASWYDPNSAGGGRVTYTRP